MDGGSINKFVEWTPGLIRMISFGASFVMHELGAKVDDGAAKAGLTCFW